MKLLVAEDTVALNRAVTALLEHEGFTVDSVFDGEEAVRKIFSDTYDAIILDIMMPKKDGLEVLAELRHRHILTPVMLLTAKAEIDDRVAGLEAGADDYLPKPFAMKELSARIKSMLRRGTDYNQRIFTYSDIVLDTDTNALTANNTIRLAVKEAELLRMLILNADREITTDKILSEIWKNEIDADRDTVWLYISYLKGKLHSIGSKLIISGSKGESFKLTEEL